MKKIIFETTLAWKDGSGSFSARVEVGADGWGKVFDLADGLYCGSLNPLRVRRIMEEARP